MKFLSIIACVLFSSSIAFAHCGSCGTGKAKAEKHSCKKGKEKGHKCSKKCDKKCKKKHKEHKKEHKKTDGHKAHHHDH